MAEPGAEGRWGARVRTWSGVDAAAPFLETALLPQVQSQAHRTAQLQLSRLLSPELSNSLFTSKGPAFWVSLLEAHSDWNPGLLRLLARLVRYDKARAELVSSGLLGVLVRELPRSHLSPPAETAALKLVKRLCRDEDAVKGALKDLGGLPTVVGQLAGRGEKMALLPAATLLLLAESEVVKGEGEGQVELNTARRRARQVLETHSRPWVGGVLGEEPLPEWSSLSFPLAYAAGAWSVTLLRPLPSPTAIRPVLPLLLLAPLWSVTGVLLSHALSRLARSRRRVLADPYSTQLLDERQQELRQWKTGRSVGRALLAFVFRFSFLPSLFLVKVGPGQREVTLEL